MNAHDRAVDHLHLAVVRLDDGVHQLVPDTGLPPPVEAIVDRRVRPVALGQITPWNNCPIAIQHSIDKQAVIFSRDANGVLSSGQ